MDAENLYVIAGVDVGPFVRTWLDDLKSGGGHSRGLLESAAENREHGDRHFYSSTFLMANIAPHAADPEASKEVKILFSALAVYQDPNDDDHPWAGFDEYVRSAFEYLHEIGPTEAAKRLLNNVIDRSNPTNDDIAFLRNMEARRSPASNAAHERDMASIRQREIEAAKVLDPDVDFDAQMIARLAGE